MSKQISIVAARRGRAAIGRQILLTLAGAIISTVLLIAPPGRGFNLPPPQITEAGNALILPASQGWPFPSGVMIGFRATALAQAVHVDGEEVIEARWFTRAELAEHAKTAGRLGREDSIDRFLLRSWLDDTT